MGSSKSTRDECGIWSVLHFHWSQRHQEVSCQFEAEPTARHARRNLEQIRRNTLVQSLDSFVLDNGRKGIPYRLVLIAHSTHGVDLESATQNVTVILSAAAVIHWTALHLQWICACLRNGT